MPFQFTCPYCFKKTFVEDKYAGQTGPCANCGKVVTLPVLSTAAGRKNLSSKTLFVAGQNAASPEEKSSILATDEPPPLFPTSSAAPASSGSSAAVVAGPSASATLLQPTKPPAVVYATELPDNAPSMRRRYFIAGATTALVILCGVIGWYSISALRNSSLIQSVQDRRNRTQCMNQLSKIARALNAYAATYGTYPPPIVYDEKGTPMHSWRVLILRELGEPDLYNRYNFDEPWNSEANSRLLVQCPSAYISPAVGATRITAEANYFLLTGPRTAFPGTSNLKPADILDGPEKMILVVEAANPIHEWTKPIDVSASGKGQITMGGCHKGGTAAAKADGQAVWIPDDAPTELLDAFMTIDGNEDVDADSFKP